MNTTIMQPEVPPYSYTIKRKPAWRRILTVLLTSTFGITFLFVAIHALIAWYIINPIIPPLSSNPYQELGLEYENILLASFSGHSSVNGWYIPVSREQKPAACWKDTESAHVAQQADYSNVSMPLYERNELHTTNLQQETTAWTTGEEAFSNMASTTGDAAFADTTGATDEDIFASAAWTADAAVSRAIIFSHGYGTNREESWVAMYDLIDHLHGFGYNILMFDYGYASQQFKTPVTGGMEEAQQLLSAVHYAKEQGNQQVIVWGFSMGAGTALQAALLTDEIDVLILDSTFLASPEALFHNIQQLIALPQYPSQALISALLPIWSRTDFNQLPIQAVLNHQYEIPILLIHGTKDTKSSYTIAEQIAANQQHPLSQAWIVPEALHEMIFRMHKEDYIANTVHFLQLTEKHER